VSGGVPAWIAPASVGVGSPIAGAAPYQVFFANAGGALAQSSGFLFQPGVGLGVNHAPSSSYGIVVSAPGKIMLDNAVNTVRELVYATTSVPRWSWRLNSDAEPGNNTGASFLLVAYNDAGAELGYPISFFRSGHTTVGVNAEYANTLCVACNNPANDVFSVRGAANQTGYLQTWYNGAGQPVATLDNAGHFVSTATGGGFLKLDANLRLDINGVVTGHPLGTLHLGPDAVGSVPNPSIVFENAIGFGNTGMLSSVARLYFRAGGNPKMVIQFISGGNTYYAYINLVPGAGEAVNWIITNSAV